VCWTSAFVMVFDNQLGSVMGSVGEKIDDRGDL
jgi:hypothetical protein